MATYAVKNWPVIGHDWAIEQITLAFNKGRTRHAYVISGPPSIGKTALARGMAMTFNCVAGSDRPCGECRPCTLIYKGAHPDLMTIEAERVGGTMKIDQIREAQRLLSLRPYEARHRVAIFQRFHEANVAAQNALLKTLEEPPGQSILILLAEDMNLLLDTIKSRCQPYPLRPLQIHEVERALIQHWNAEERQAALLAHLSGGRIGWAIEALNSEDVLKQREDTLALLETLLMSNRRFRFSEMERFTKDKTQLFEMLRLWESFWRDALLLANGNQRWLTHIDREDFLQHLVGQHPMSAFQTALQATRRTMNYLQRNVNTRLAIETLMLDYPFTPALN